MMNRMGFIFCLCASILSVCFLQGCATTQPNLLVLPDRPMLNTILRGYAEIHEVYESDDMIHLEICFDRISKPENPKFRLAIKNNKGETIYDKTWTDKVEPYHIEDLQLLYYYCYDLQIPFNQELKEKLSSGDFIISFYMDDKPLGIKILEYIPASDINKNIKQIVVLPFYAETMYLVEKEVRMTLDTLAYNIYLAAKRIAPETIPHYVAEAKLADISIPKCFSDPACLERLKQIYGEGVFITGEVKATTYQGNDVEFHVYVYNTKTAQIQEFKCIFVAQRAYYQDFIKSVLNEILYNQGFLNYLKGL